MNVFDIEFPGSKIFYFRPISFVDKTSQVKAVPNFSDMHNRLFNKAESIDEVLNRHEHRGKILLSGKKPTASQSKIIDFQNSQCFF